MIDDGCSLTNAEDDSKDGCRLTKRVVSSHTEVRPDELSEPCENRITNRVSNDWFSNVGLVANMWLAWTSNKSSLALWK